MNIPLPARTKSFFLAVGSIVMALAVFATVSLASASDTVFGYTWSPNVGWMHMNNCDSDNRTACPPVSYGVTIAPTGAVRAISGNMWSSNIGWVTFDSSAGCPASVPATSCQPAVTWATGKVTGWARACSVFASGCSGALQPAYKTGGWDGWISLGDTNTSDSANFGVTLNTTTGVFSGFGWGADIVGWIDFSNVKYISGMCPDGTTPAPNGDPSQCPPPILCSDGTPAPNGQVRQCPFCDIIDINGVEQCNHTCPDGSAAPNSDLNQCPSCPAGTHLDPTTLQCVPNTCPPFTHPNPSNPTQCIPNPECSDGIDNDGDGQIDFPNDPGCTDDDDDDETDPPTTGTCTDGIQNQNETGVDTGGVCGPGGPVDQCTNIPDYIPMTTPPTPPYRQLPDGRCLCSTPGYVLNTQYICVPLVYTER